MLEQPTIDIWLSFGHSHCAVPTTSVPPQVLQAFYKYKKTHIAFIDKKQDYYIFLFLSLPRISVKKKIIYSILILWGLRFCYIRSTFQHQDVFVASPTT
jgi:hypothetical protein